MAGTPEARFHGKKLYHKPPDRDIQQKTVAMRTFA
jgi:hypothetical protein